MSDMALRLLVEQRKRLVATIMGHAEREIFGRLSVDEQKEFRSRVLTSIDVFTDLIRDLIKVGQVDAITNEETLRIVQQIHHQIHVDRMVAHSG